MSKIPSPCIGVCKFKRDGHCIGCSMTKPQKSAFRKLKKEAHRAAFVELVVAQQTVMGRYKHWSREYQRRCRKKKVAFSGSDEGRAA